MQEDSIKNNRFKNYFKENFQRDLFAGITVSMIAIPQSMAYAAIGGLEPIIGLYAAMVPTIVAALIGSSRFFGDRGDKCSCFDYGEYSVFLFGNTWIF